MESCTGTVRDVQQPSEDSTSAQGITPSKKFNLKHLINKINYIHFLDGTITACFRHKRYDTSLSVLIKPQPCTDQNLICSWETSNDLQIKLKAHQFQHLLVNDGQKSLLVEPKPIEISDDHLCFTLPDECRELNSRQIRRHSCRDIRVELIQNGSSFKGTLIEFSPKSLHIRINAAPPQTFQWLNPESPAALILSRQNETLYSTECTIFKQSCGQNTRSIVLTPNNDRIFKFKPKKYRSTRQRLSPSPSINFIHPLTGKWMDLEVKDISGSGLSITESPLESCLLPGLIIPALSLTFANSDSLNCKAQVVYRIPGGYSKEPHKVKCGIAFLDMQIEEQARLLAILYQADNKRSYLSNKVDLETLWKFFFDTGFIYPQKYLHLKSNKKRLKKTYELLYEKRPDIAKHFIYQENGLILAHISMLRFYRSSWLIHHHASRKAETLNGGISVLRQISRYANEAHRLYSAHLDFVFCYYRQNNRFPKRLFGGVKDYIDNPKACSVDSFSYLYFKRSFGKGLESEYPWSLNKSSIEDLEELKRFIDYSSGGLMIPALDLDKTDDERGLLEKEYQSLGMMREQHLFSLKIKGSIKAIIIINKSEILLNMSDLTNCFKIIIIEPEGLTSELLFLALSILCIKFDLEELPALIYPTSFAESQNIQAEKTYNLWILNLQHLDEYFDFCSKMIRNFDGSTSDS